MNAVTARLVHRGATILVKHLSRNEEFKQFVEKFHPNLSPTEVEALVKSEMEHLSRRIELNGTDDQKALLDLMRSDVDVRQENYWENYLSDRIDTANMSEDLKEILSEFQEIEAFSSDLSSFAESNVDIFREDPASFWNLDGLTDEEVQAKVQQYVDGYSEQLAEVDRSLTDEFAAAERIFAQLRELDEANVSAESSISDSASGAVSDDPVIREIIDAVSDGTNAAEIREIVSKIREFDLDTHDIIEALKQEITSGPTHTPREAFDPQDLRDNCVQALSKVIAAQFGRHVPEGVITLHALLEGRLQSIDLLYNKCFELLVVKFCPYIPIGTLPLQLTLTLEDLGIPVDIDYDATLEDAAAKLAEGKLVMVGLNVKPLAPWNGQEDGHVVQLVDIDWEQGTVTVIDTGVRDYLGRPNGNHIAYDIEQFQEAMRGREVIFTRESPSSATREESNAEVSESTPETGDIPQTSMGGELGEDGVELTHVLNAYPPPDSESEPDETDRVDGSDASSEGDTTDATLNNALSAKSDEGDPSKNNVEEISEATPEVTSPGYVPDNTANSASPGSPDVEGQDDGNADVSGF